MFYYAGLQAEVSAEVCPHAASLEASAEALLAVVEFK